MARLKGAHPSAMPGLGRNLKADDWRCRLGSRIFAPGKGELGLRAT